MSVRKTLSAAIAALLLTTIPTLAQTSVYSNMSVAGDLNSWSASPNLELVGDHLWEGEFEVSGAARSEFKFVFNNWNVEIGESNQTSFVPPFSGIAERVNPYQGNIIVSNVPAGRYRFTLNDSNFSYSVAMVYAANSGVNLLNNSSFETAGTSSEEARNWQYGTPDANGGKWGRAARRDFRSRSGQWQGALQGQWSLTDENHGGWWQQGPAKPGLLYEGSAWFWADADWTSEYQDIKIEFYNSSTGLIETTTTPLGEIGEAWTRCSTRAVAPPGTAIARLIIAMSGAGRHGTLQVDDAELRAVAVREQDFNSWSAFTNNGCHTLDDWTLCEGYATTNAMAGYAAALSPSTVGQTNYLQSPQFVDGIGMIYFSYRHGAVDEPEEGVSIAIEKSTDGNTWTLIGSLEDIMLSAYRQHSLFHYETAPSFLRIRHSAGTNAVFIDDIIVAAPANLTRFQDFDSWPAAEEVGEHNFLNWSVRSGIVAATPGFAGKALILPGASDGTNFIQSPRFADGYGTIEFKYARGTNGLAPASFLLQSSEDGTNWTSLALQSDILSTSPEVFSQYFYNHRPSYIRICNSSLVELTPLILEEGFAGGITAPPGWSFSGITSTYSSSGNYGNEPPSLRFDTTSDTVTTPVLVNPTNVSMWLKGQGTDANSYLLIEVTTNNATWMTNTIIQPIPTSGTIIDSALPTNAVRLRFRYTKVVGNLSLDDVVISGIPRSAGNPQHLMIDDIDIRYPILSRFQNFNNWPRQQSYSTSSHQGWMVSNSIVTSELAFEGQAARLNSAIGSYILSPLLLDGLGPIDFQYRHWDGDGSTVSYSIQTSPDMVDWTTLTTLSISSTNWTTFSQYFYLTNALYVRLYHSGGIERALFDDIDLLTLRPPADVLLNAWPEPLAPYTNDPVAIAASIHPINGAVSPAATAYYRVGTSGVFSIMPMSASTGSVFRTVSSIPPQQSGTTVQYYLACSFSGPGAEMNSPRFFPPEGSNAPAEYRIPRNRPGKTWINEINYLNENWWNDDTNEFVEICAPAGWDVSGWTIELYVSLHTNTHSYYASYEFPPDSIVQPVTNGYGFFVVGDLTVPNVNLAFSHITPYPLGQDEDDHIVDGVFPSGVKLYNEGGGLEHSISYAGPIEGFNRIHAREDWNNPDPDCLQLTGTGSYYTAFLWTTNQATPGNLNEGQYLTPLDDPPPQQSPLLDIVHIVVGTNVTITTRGNTNMPAWAVAPYWATNLAAPSQDWQPVSPFSSSPTEGGTNRVWFDLAPSKVRVFRIRGTP